MLVKITDGVRGLSMMYGSSLDENNRIVVPICFDWLRTLNLYGLNISVAHKADGGYYAFSTHSGSVNVLVRKDAISVYEPNLWWPMAIAVDGKSIRYIASANGHTQPLFEFCKHELGCGGIIYPEHFLMLLEASSEVRVSASDAYQLSIRV